MESPQLRTEFDALGAKNLFSVLRSRFCSRPRILCEAGSATAEYQGLRVGNAIGYGAPNRKPRDHRGASENHHIAVVYVVAIPQRVPVYRYRPQGRAVVNFIDRAPPT